MEFLFTHLKPGSFVPVYCDTDSITSGLTESGPAADTLKQKLISIFEPIVKTEMKKSWNSQWQDWFVTDPKNVFDARKPGKLKLEMLITRGRFIGLR